LFHLLKVQHFRGDRCVIYEHGAPVCSLTVTINNRATNPATSSAPTKGPEHEQQPSE
jgi:hypothetical protein